MAKLRPGAVTIDLETGGIYGDLDHCPREDLLESAEALLSLLPKVNHRGLWGLAKAWDADCYVYSEAASFRVPEDIRLELYRGNDVAGRRFRLVPLGRMERDVYWRFHWYEPLIGSLRDGKVSPDTEGIPDLTAEARAERERQAEEIRRREASKHRQLKMELS